MSLKKDWTKEMKLLEAEINILEGKRSRSQACLVEALITNQEPDPNETHFFRAYTAEIEVKRERLWDLKEQLKLLKK